MAILSVVASGAYFVVSNVQDSSRNTKLMRDVATVNSALRMYEAGGGSLATLNDPQAVLDRMKAVMTGTAAKQIAGLKGRLIDPRLAVALQSTEEGKSSTQRAYWRNDLRQFVISESGSPGIREFVLDEALASRDYGTDNTRHSSFNLAAKEKWVWDFKDKAAPDSSGPGTLPSPSGDPGPTGAPAAPKTLPLNPPSYSRGSGTYVLTSYPMNVDLTNPNPAGTSRIIYAVSGAGWKNYNGTLKVDPGQKLEAMAISVDPDHWDDSSKALETYLTTPVQPQFRLTFDKTSYTYVELGGALMPGAYVDTKREKAGTLNLTNSSAIPLTYQSSDYFRAYWTLDGSDPLTNNAATKGDDFTGGFTGQNIPVTLADFGSSTSITVKAAARTANSDILTNSTVTSQVLDIQKVKLRPPLITMNDHSVTLSLQVNFGDMPAGARIFYTTDGTDPGDNNGEPVTGTEYKGVFEVAGATGSMATITARTYPPVGYNNWFTTSDMAQEQFKLPAVTDFYVGGNFYLSIGSSTTMRNIAKLKGIGAVDSTFDVGTGASENSLVGIVRAEASGKVFAGGDFETINNMAIPGLVRLNPNGSVDSSFNAGLSGQSAK